MIVNSEKPVTQQSELIWRERCQLMNSENFLRAPVMRRLLDYLVLHRLSGEPFPLKSYTIAVEALGKPHDFDPQIDSYPRVQIGRLRRMIDDHYERNQAAAQICIPKHDYRIMLIRSPAHQWAKSA